MDILPGEETGAAWRAQRRSGEVIQKLRALAADAVDVGSLDERMAGNPERIPAQVVHEDENDIGPRGARGRGQQRGRRGRKKIASCEHDKKVPGTFLAKFVSERELHGSGTALTFGRYVVEIAAGGFVEVAIGKLEVGMIKDVESLPTELHALALAGRNILEQAQVDV